MPIPKSKINRKGDIDEPASFDQCQTPIYALDPLLPYLPKDKVIWECACGKGNLVIGLKRLGYNVVSTDLSSSDEHYSRNFFHWEPDTWDIIVTNPPFSVKFEWIERCNQLGKPWALLLRLEVLGAARAQRQFERYDMELILLNKRINFEMPNMGTSGGGAWFPVAWFTHGLNIGTPTTFGKIIPRPDKQPFLLEI